MSGIPRGVCSIKCHHGLRSSFWQIRRFPQSLSLPGQCLSPWRSLSLISYSWDQQGQAPLRNSGAKDGGGGQLLHQPDPNLGPSQSCFKVNSPTDTKLGTETWPTGMSPNEGSRLCSSNQRDREGGVVVWI